MEKKPRSDTEEPKPLNLKKALGVGQILNTKVTLFDLQAVDENLYQALGNVPVRGVWFVWGGSGSGKSSFVMDVVKAYCSQYKALHNELEEEIDDHDFIERVKLKNMQDVRGKYTAASYNLKQLTQYLEGKYSPEIVLINSATYLFKTLDEYFEFVRRFKRRKVIIITGMAKGKNPYTELETRIMYDANKKVFCEGYLASCKGRTIGPNGGRYIIWAEGYEKLHGVQDNEKKSDDEH
jgi:hypothetical protein